jgi:hypothetical protein
MEELGKTFFMILLFLGVIKTFKFRHSMILDSDITAAEASALGNVIIFPLLLILILDIQ